MRYHQKSPTIFFSIIIIVLIGVVFYLYSNNIFYPGWNADLSFENASIKITTNWGECPTAFPCYETYQLNFELGSDVTISHNGSMQGKLGTDQSKKLIKETYGLYTNNICTPQYLSGTTQNYELNIDQKIYTFGNDKGCKEMQNIIDIIKGAGGV